MTRVNSVRQFLTSADIVLDTCRISFFSNQTISVFCFSKYSKCPKILYTKVSDKMAYADSVDPDQTASEGAD